MNATQRKKLLELAAALAKVSQELADLHTAIIWETPVAGKVPKTKAFTFVGKGSIELRQRALRNGWTLFSYSRGNCVANWHGDSPTRSYYTRKTT